MMIHGVSHGCHEEPYIKETPVPPSPECKSRVFSLTSRFSLGREIFRLSVDDPYLTLLFGDENEKYHKTTISGLLIVGAEKYRKYQKVCFRSQFVPSRDLMKSAL